jgi:hypothetical protein
MSTTKMHKQTLLSSSLILMLGSVCVQPMLADGQDIKDESGNMFMEETTPAPRAKPPNIKIDLSNVGVPVDPKGHIVPLIDHDAPGGVRQNFSNLEVYSEPAWNFLPAPVYNAYGQPYNFNPTRRYGAPYGMPYGSPFGGGYGMPYGAPYYPYNNNSGINLGNLHLNFGNPSYGLGSPGYGFGAPGYGFGAPGYGYGVPGYGYGGPGFGYGAPGFGYGAPGFGLGMPNLNPITNPYPTGPVFGAPPIGGLFGPSPMFSSPMFPSPMLGASGVGLNLFVPPKVEWQSNSTITPLTPNLDGPD